MILTEKCCLLHQSQRLAELGVTAESECYHISIHDTATSRVNKVVSKNSDLAFVILKGQAYTVAELLQALPKEIDEYELTISNVNNFWRVEYVKFQTEYRTKYSSMHERLPSLLAILLIALLENNLLTAEQVNEAINR